MTSKYLNDWNAAISRTTQLGLSVPDHNVQPNYRYLTEARQAEFPYVVQRGIGDLDFPDVVAQCLAIHFRLAPILQEWLKCPVLYTLGWIDTGNDGGLFKFDDDFIAQKLKDGHSGGLINIHAWLTLPSMEIIDVALATTMAIVKNHPDGYGAVIAKHADDLKGMTYKPMLVGDDFLRKTGLLVEFGEFAYYE